MSREQASLAAVPISVRIESEHVRANDFHLPGVQRTIAAAASTVVVRGSRIETRACVGRMTLFRRGRRK